MKIKHLTAKFRSQNSYFIYAQVQFLGIIVGSKSGREKDKDFIVKVISVQAQDLKKKKKAEITFSNQSKKAEQNESQKCLLRI